MHCKAAKGDKMEGIPEERGGEKTTLVRAWKCRWSSPHFPPSLPLPFSSLCSVCCAVCIQFMPQASLCLPLALSLSNCPYKQQQLGLIGPGLQQSTSGSGREGERQLFLDTIRFLWRHIWCAGHMCVSIVMKLWGLLSLSQNELSY